MSYTLDSIVALINRKEPLPSPFLKALNNVKSSAHHLGIHKLTLKELCSDLDLELTEQNYDSESSFIDCDYLYKLVSVLLRHDVAMMPMGVPRNLSIYNQIYLTARADILADSDIYQLQTLKGQKKTKYTNNEIEVIIRARKKIQNFNTILHVFESLGAARSAPLENNQRMVLNDIIDDMLLPRDAERYVRNLFSYACELGSFNYDFTNPKYVSVANGAWGDEGIKETIDMVARIIAPAHLAITIPEDFPHAQLLQELYSQYCPMVFTPQETVEVKNIIPVSERQLSEINFNQRHARLKEKLDALLKEYHNTKDSNQTLKLCDQSKNEILQSRPGYSSDLIRRVAVLPKQYGNLTSYIDNLQQKLMKDEDTRLLVPNFGKTLLSIYIKDDDGVALTPTTITKRMLNTYCKSNNFALDGDPNAQANKSPLGSASASSSNGDSNDVTSKLLFADNSERLSYVMATESVLKETLAMLDVEERKAKAHQFIENSTSGQVAIDRKPVNSNSNTTNTNDKNPYLMYSSKVATISGDMEAQKSNKRKSTLLIDPCDFSEPKAAKDSSEQTINEEVTNSEQSRGIVNEDSFHVVPYTFDRVNFLFHSYLVWSDDEKLVVNDPTQGRPNRNEDYGTNLEQFIRHPDKNLARFNRVISYEFLLRKLFGAANNSSALNDLGCSDEHEVEHLFELISHNDSYLSGIHTLPLVLYHGLYYFDRYLQNPSTHFNNELFYIAVFKREPYALNLYLSRIFHKYGPRLIDVPQEFYTLFVFNLLLFPQNDSSTMCQRLANDIFKHTNRSSNLHKVVLIRTIAQQLYDFVTNNHKDCLTMEFLCEDEVTYRNNWDEFNAHMHETQKLFSSLLPEQYFEQVCLKNSFYLCLEHTVSRYARLDSKDLNNSESITNNLNYLQLKSVGQASEALFTLLATMDKVLTLIDELSTKVDEYLIANPIKKAFEEPQLDKDKLKEDLASLDLETQTPIFKPKRRQIKKDKEQEQESQFESAAQEREDIFKDYAQRFSKEGKKDQIIDDDLGGEGYQPRWELGKGQTGTKAKSLSASDLAAKLMAKRSASNSASTSASVSSATNALSASKKGSNNNANASNSTDSTNHKTSAAFSKMIASIKEVGDKIDESKLSGGFNTMALYRKLDIDSMGEKQLDEFDNPAFVEPQVFKDPKLMALVEECVTKFKAIKELKLTIDSATISHFLTMLKRQEHLKGVKDQFYQDIQTIIKLFKLYQQNEHDHSHDPDTCALNFNQVIVDFGQEQFIECLHRLNIYFMNYGCMTLASVMAKAKGYGQVLAKSPSANQKINAYYAIDWAKTIGRGSPFFDDIIQPLLDNYVVPLVKKLVCSNHNYLYSFSHNIDFNKRLEAIGSLVREDYLRDFVLIGLPFNRFVVDCACAQGSESYINKMRSYAFKVQEASAIGFPNGIASERVYELSSLLNKTIGVQIVPYVFNNISDVNYSVLRPSIKDITILPIPESYGFTAAAIDKNQRNQVNKESYEDLLFTLYCAHIVLETLYALMPVAKESGLLKLLAQEIVAIHHLEFDEEASKFIQDYLQGCLHFINKQGAIEQSLLLSPKDSLSTMILGTRADHRLKRLIIFAFGYQLKQGFVSTVVKKQFTLVLKNLKLVAEFTKAIRNSHYKTPAKRASSDNPIPKQGFYQPHSGIKNQQLNLDMNMIKAKIKESEQVQEVITELRDKEQMLQEQELFSSLTSKASSAPAEPAQSEPALGQGLGSVSAAASAQGQGSASEQGPKIASVNAKENAPEHQESLQPSTANTHPIMTKLDVKVRNVIEALAVQGTDAMVYSEFNGICVSHGLISGNYCIEVLNEYSFEEYDEPVLELDGHDDSAIVYITTDLLEQMNQDCQGS